MYKTRMVAVVVSWFIVMVVMSWFTIIFLVFSGLLTGGA